MTRRRRFGRWVERALLGSVMSVIAFIIERRVLRAIRAKGQQPSQPEIRTGELAPER